MSTLAHETSFRLIEIPFVSEITALKLDGPRLKDFLSATFNVETGIGSCDLRWMRWGALNLEPRNT